MLFRKKIEPCCAYCARGTKLDERQVACRKHGVVPSGSFCGAFRYDPLLREPPAPALFQTDKLSEEDFQI